MAVPQDDELKKLLDEFVCVRLVQMWNVDLDVFQFDFAMTWAVFFMNGDGSIYGRYGSRSALREQSTREISVAGFREAMKAALELHQRYQKDPAAVKPEIAGKRTQREQPWSRAQDIPQLKERKLAIPFRNGPYQHASCIHCHMVPNHELWSLQQKRKPISDRMIWPFPMPDVVGMHMDPEHMATVDRVAPESAAAAAGVEQGDRIARIDGQTILSTADIQWTLHEAEDKDQMALDVLRGGQPKQLTLELADGWRRKAHDWRATNSNVASWIVGFNCDALPPGRRQQLGLAPQAMALVVRRVHKKILGNADLRQNDVIIEIDGNRKNMSFGEFTAYLTREKKKGSTMKVVRRRGGGEGGEGHEGSGGREETIRIKVN